MGGMAAAAEYGQVPASNAFTFSASAAPPVQEQYGTGKITIERQDGEFAGLQSGEEDFEGEFGALKPEEIPAIEHESALATDTHDDVDLTSPVSRSRSRSRTPASREPSNTKARDRPDSIHDVDSISAEQSNSISEDRSNSRSEESSISAEQSNSLSEESVSRSLSGSLEDEDESEEASEEIESEETGESGETEESGETSESREVSAVTSESEEVLEGEKGASSCDVSEEESSEVAEKEDVPDIIDEEDEEEQDDDEILAKDVEKSESVAKPIPTKVDAPAVVTLDEISEEAEASLEEEDEVDEAQSPEKPVDKSTLENEEDETKKAGGIMADNNQNMRDMTMESTCDTPDANNNKAVDDPGSISKPRKLSNVMQFAPVTTLKDDQVVGSCTHAIDYLRSNDFLRATSVDNVSNSVTASIWQMFLEQRAGDARIVCKLGESLPKSNSYVFSVHKTILNMRCPALLLKSQYPIKPGIMLQILYYVYTDTVPTAIQMDKWDIEYIFAVLTASSDLGIDRFRRVVIKHLVGRLAKPFDGFAEIVTRALAEPRCDTVIYACARAMFDEQEFFFDQDRLVNLCTSLEGKPKTLGLNLESNGKALGLISYVSMAASNPSIKRNEFLKKYDNSDLTSIPSTLSSDLEQLNNVSCPPDVCLKTGGKSFHVHSAILNGRCTYFADRIPRGNDKAFAVQDLQTLTGGELAQKNAKREDEFNYVLDHEDFTQDLTAITGVLKFIYTGKFPKLELTSALNALKILGDWTKQDGSLGLTDCQVGRDMLYLQVKQQWLGEEMVQILNVFDTINIGDKEMDEGVSFCFKFFNVQCSDEIVSSLPHRPALKLLALFSSGSGRGLTPKKVPIFDSKSQKSVFSSACFNLINSV